MCKGPTAPPQAATIGRPAVAQNSEIRCEIQRLFGRRALHAGPPRPEVPWSWVDKRSRTSETPDQKRAYPRLRKGPHSAQLREARQKLECLFACREKTECSRAVVACDLLRDFAQVVPDG